MTATRDPLVATLDGHFEALKLVLPPATQPGLLGEAARLLPVGIRDHIPSSYLTALGFKV